MNIDKFVDSYQFPKLAHAVIQQLGGGDAFRKMAPYIVRHGMAGGFEGFKYCTETQAFFDKNKRDILGLVQELAEDIGEDPMCVIQSFNCLKADEFSTWEIAEAIFSETEDSAVVRNALAWFAAEEVARAWLDYEYQGTFSHS